MAANFTEPKLAQQVRYVLGDASKNRGQVRVATIVMLHDSSKDDGLVNLNVLCATEHDFGIQGNLYVPSVLSMGVRYDAGKAPGTWHYEEVPASPSKK